MNDFTCATDDGDAPYPNAATFFPPSDFMSSEVSVVWMVETGGPLPKSEMTFSLPGAP